MLYVPWLTLLNKNDPGIRPEVVYWGLPSTFVTSLFLYFVPFFIVVYKVTFAPGTPCMFISSAFPFIIQYTIGVGFGVTVGFFVGVAVGSFGVGVAVGVMVGEGDGVIVGSTVGVAVAVGVMVGSIVGVTVGVGLPLAIGVGVISSAPADNIRHSGMAINDKTNRHIITLNSFL